MNKTLEELELDVRELILRREYAEADLEILDLIKDDVTDRILYLGHKLRLDIRDVKNKARIRIEKLQDAEAVAVKEARKHLVVDLHDEFDENVERVMENIKKLRSPQED